MNIRLSVHARYQIRQRNIHQSEIIVAITTPDTLKKEPSGRFRALKQTEINGKIYLLVIIFEKSTKGIIVVTAFRTSKMEKYR